MMRLGRPFTEVSVSVYGWFLVVIPLAITLLATALIVTEKAVGN